MVVDEKKAYTYFKNRFLMRKSTNGFFVFDCPFCIHGTGNRKCGVNFSWLVVKCWVCGYKDYVANFVKDNEGVTYTEAKAILENEQASNVDLEVFENVVTERRVMNLDLPTGYKSLLDGDGILAQRARNYLRGRGFDLDYLDSIGFGYCDEKGDTKENDYFGYIIIPFKKRGQLYYFIGRDFVGNFLRYKNPATETFGIGKGDFLFNEDALELSSTNYITEGWADAMTMGKGGVASLGWALSQTQRSKLYESSAHRFVFLPDVGNNTNGTTFYQEATKLALDFIDHKECLVVDLSKAGVSGKDVNEIGRERVAELIRNTPVLTEGIAMDILIG